MSLLRRVHVPAEDGSGVVDIGAGFGEVKELPDESLIRLRVDDRGGGVEAKTGGGRNGNAGGRERGGGSDGQEVDWCRKIDGEKYR